MARPRKKVVKPDVEKVVEVKPEEKPQTRVVKKAIKNPLRLNDHIVLSDDKPYTIPGNLLDNEMFMAHIEYLITLKKLERV